MGRRFLLLLLAVGAVAAACGSGSDSERNDAAETRTPKIVDLTTILQLRGTFNEDRGKARLLLLLSPT